MESTFSRVRNRRQEIFCCIFLAQIFLRSRRLFCSKKCNQLHFKHFLGVYLRLEVNRIIQVRIISPPPEIIHLLGTRCGQRVRMDFSWYRRCTTCCIQSGSSFLTPEPVFLVREVGATQDNRTVHVIPLLSLTRMPGIRTYKELQAAWGALVLAHLK